VPVYDPTVIYGPWSDAYVPFYWYPPAFYGYPELGSAISVGIFFGTAFRIDYNHWGWARPNWRGHDIDVNVTHNYFANRPQYANRWRDGRWAHSPEQGRSVASRDIGSPGGWLGNAALQSREPYRTRQPVPTQQAIARPPQFQQPYARPQQSQQSQQSYMRPLEVQQSYARPTQPQPPITRTTPQPERPIARPVQQPQQGAWNAPRQSMYSVVHPTPQVQQAFARPLSQQPSREGMSRALPQRPQSFARSMPTAPRQIAAPMPQPSARSEPQFAYNPQPHAQVQANARYGDGHRS
jgi:hypothetical protein